tara:strand:- start:245 stop:487 length:243 start_codon:yes stop_codon:yes gene_type:complete
VIITILTIGKKMINALRKKYEAEIAAAQANINVYMKNPAGIGEHPDLVAAVDSEMVKLADAEDKLATLNKHYGNQPDLLT